MQMPNELLTRSSHEEKQSREKTVSYSAEVSWRTSHYEYHSSVGVVVLSAGGSVARLQS